jgi:thioredoxin-like negative regulator of GroEL
VLIQSIDSRSLLSIPAQLGKIWRESSMRSSSELLGAKFEKLIAAYDQGGFAAVKKRLSDASISPVMQADAYTALARCLLNSDHAGAAEAARCAYEIDPRAYRLKWLIFRLYDTGEVVEAEAMLDVLPPETSFSESESRQARRLRSEARLARQREVRKNRVTNAALVIKE